MSEKIINAFRDLQNQHADNQISEPIEMRKDIIEVLNNCEDVLVPILIGRGFLRLITPKKGFKWSNTKVTDKGKELLKKTYTPIPDGWMEKYREIWPSEFRSSPKEIEGKLRKFQNEYPDLEATYDEILQAAQAWVQQNDPPFCGTASNFFHKVDKGTVVCRVYSAVEDVRNGGYSTSLPDIEVV